MLNRPSGTDLDEAGADWEGWDLLAAQPPVVFVGGPVSRTAVICVARLGDGGAEGFQPLLGDIGLANMGGPPRGIDAVRLFAGYAGWGGGQLEGEIDEGAWFVVDADPGDALTADPDDPLGGRASPPGRPAGDVRPLPGRPVPELAKKFSRISGFRRVSARVDGRPNAAAVRVGRTAGFSLPLSSGSEVRPAHSGSGTQALGRTCAHDGSDREV